MRSDKFGHYTELRHDLLLETIQKLEQRIRERFPEAGLARLCRDFCEFSKEAQSLALRLRPPIWPVRIAVYISSALLLGLVFWALAQVATHFKLKADNVPELLQATESAINEVIFLGLALFFLVGLETRLKRQSALKALHHLRSIAHVVDMHQLTKDPALLLNPMKQTSASPARTLNRQQLSRYLDYCSELLALIAKIAALFAQNTDDSVVLGAVNDLEQLTQGLSGKIWQKIMILDLAEDDTPGQIQ